MIETNKKTHSHAFNGELYQTFEEEMVSSNETSSEYRSRKNFQVIL